MDAGRRAYLMLIVVFLFGLAPERTLGAASPVTLARATLAQATAAAKARRPDAVLTQLDSSNVNAQGMAYWRYIYFSRSAPAAANCLLINVYSGRPVALQELDGCEQGAVAGDFIDTDQLNTIARAKGITKPRVTMVLMSSPTRPGGATWMVMDESGTAPGNVMLDIDAKTGQVLEQDVAALSFFALSR